MNTKFIKIPINECFECGSKVDIVNHHVIPKSLGGRKKIPLCLECHGLVHNIDFIEMKKLQTIGIQNARKKGLFRGRIKGSVEDRDIFRLKPKTRLVKSLLKDDYGIREISRLAKCSPNFVYKVKNFFNPVIFEK